MPILPQWNCKKRKRTLIQRQLFPGSCAIKIWMMTVSQFSHSVVSDSATPWTAARQASLSITNSQSLLKLMSIESVMTSSHLILCRPFSPAPNTSQHQGLFQWDASDSFLITSTYLALTSNKTQTLGQVCLLMCLLSSLDFRFLEGRLGLAHSLVKFLEMST